MAQTGNFKSPARLGSLGAGAESSSSGAVVGGGKPREDALKGVNVDRRNFLFKVVGGVGAVVAASTLYPVVKYIIPPVKKITRVNELNVGKLADIASGTGKIFQFNEAKVIVINRGGELTACSAVCTHLGCLVRWEEANNQLFCPCHGAKYKQTGEIISGPQPLPLAKYGARVENGDIIISKA